MTERDKFLEPWEVSPDEAYWQALLEEGEYGEDVARRAAVEQGDEGEARPTTVGQSGDGVGGAISAEQSVVAGQQAPPRSPAGADVDQGTEHAASWNAFIACQKQDRAVDLDVVGFNRGGLLVKWLETVGFVPASQLCDSISSADETVRREALAAQVGKTLTLKVIEVNPLRNRLILSERAARGGQSPDPGILDRLSPGDVCQGSVTNLCSFGVFVDLGGIEGLIHISELSWGRVAHPSDVLKSGQEVEVYVLNVDQERGRVGLSLKRLHPDPWETAESRYVLGEIAEGVVTNVVNFGAFVRLEEGVEGLIHNSEWDDLTPQQRVREGDVVQVRVISLERERHRMGLSLEQVIEDEAPSTLA